MNDEIEMHDRSDGCKIRWQQLIIEPTVNVIDKQPIRFVEISDQQGIDSSKIMKEKVNHLMGDDNIGLPNHAIDQL